MSIPEFGPNPVRVIACGALAREIEVLSQTPALSHISLTCLPAILHNHPDRIPDAVDDAIVKARAEGWDNIFIGYADCGTGGALDKVCEKHGVQRIDGPHCYAFFTGIETFTGWEEHDAFYLTDFLARQFEAFVIKPLKLDKHPELIPMMFGNYNKIVYLEQQPEALVEQKARAAAAYLKLEFHKRPTGLAGLADALRA
ncbi:MAG: DUF1638 domain-containing protein [Pseudomonadota bacterium]